MVKLTAGTARGARGREYQIRDTERLAVLIRDAIAEFFGGNHLAAARSVGIPNSTLQRYAEQRGQGLREGTFLKIQRLLGPARRVALGNAVLSPSARRALDNHTAWVEEEIAGILAGRPLTARMERLAETFEVEEWRLEVESGYASDRGVALESVLANLQRRYPKVWVPLDKRLRGRGHSRIRSKLACLRVVEPLLDSNDTSGIERAWRELSDREMRVFLAAGVKREQLLLDRDADIRRAQVAVRWAERPRKATVPTKIIDRKSSARR